jgi:hypothetical protein
MRTGTKDRLLVLVVLGVVGLNDWSHQGIPLSQYGWDADECRRRLGPSYADEPAAFRREIGDDEALLKVQARVLGEKEAA